MVNAGSVEAQIGGGAVHAINTTPCSQQTFASGAAQVKNVNNSKMIEIGEMPTVAVTLMPPMAGAGRSTPIGERTMHRVFVFGTLKQGFRNFHVNRGARLGGDVVTAQPYPL